MPRSCFSFGLLFTLVLLGCQPQPAPEAPPAPLDLRFHGVRLGVTDMEAALQFYRDKMGYTITSATDDHATLANTTMAFYLHRVSEAPPPPDPATARDIITFQAQDLLATIEQLKARGVRFLDDAPQRNGVGHSIRFVDPFGHVHSMLEQQVGNVPPFAEPRIYNVGFNLRNFEAARSFYADKLGFEVRSEHYDPAFPMGHADGSFAFMIHEFPETPTRTEGNYPAQATILFETPDLDAAWHALEYAGIEVVHEAPQAGSAGRYVAFRDPFGNVSEVVERPR